jgi:hypothetical protein
MKVIVFMKDGDLHRVIPAPGRTADSLDINKVVPSGATHKIIENDMPSHILRNAWKLSGSEVSVDIPKGKVIAHELRREKRAEALSENIEIIKQDAAGIPLKAGQSAATAKSENTAYMVKDDKAQSDIDAATTATNLLSALSGVGIS